jgi:hypothetical protein
VNSAGRTASPGKEGPTPLWRHSSSSEVNHLKGNVDTSKEWFVNCSPSLVRKGKQGGKTGRKRGDKFAFSEPIALTGMLADVEIF